VTVIGFARTARRDRERSSHRGAPQITRLEARLLMLRTAGGAVATLPARREDPPLRSTQRSGVSVGAYANVAFWLIVLTIFGAGYYVIDQGGHAAPRQSAAPTILASGTGRVPVTVEPGDVMVRVTVRSAAVPWFWCLESSRGLPLEQHLCRNSNEAASAAGSIATAGVVHLDAPSVDGATFFVQMYCRDACDWRADTDQHPP
jgi:hypothetical protein